MIKVARVSDGKIHFTGGGLIMLRFVSCIQRNLRAESVRQYRRGVSIPESAVSAVAECAREFGVDLSAFSETINKFKLHEEARRAAMKIIAEKDDAEIPEKWGFLETHQKTAVNAMTRKNLLGVCLFDEQGTGKTFAALAAFDLLKDAGEIDFMMVVAPQSALNAWRDDAKKIPSFRVSIVEGTAEKKSTALRARADIYALSYDSLPSILQTAKATANRGKCLLVADEAFKIKNPVAERSRMIRELRAVCARAFVLSGTPAPRTPEDVIHQSDVADNGYAFQGYRSVGDREKDAEAVYNTLVSRGMFLRRTKEEVLPELPPKDLRVIPIALSGRQRALYEDARDNLELHLTNMNNERFKKELTDYFQRRAKLLQMCGCPSMVDEMFPDDHAKIKKLDELVEEIVVNNGGKLVVWTGYTRSVEEIARRYDRHGTAVIYGKISSEQRRDAIDRFQNDPATRIFVGNPAAAGAGITLHAAADNVYMSYTDKAADFIQSIDRTHRIGQTADSVRYYFLVCENTIEINQIRLLKDKILRQHLIFGESAEWPATVEDALQELSGE